MMRILGKHSETPDGRATITAPKGHLGITTEGYSGNSRGTPNNNNYLLLLLLFFLTALSSEFWQPD